MKWEPLPLPIFDESPCFSTTESAPASWTRKWMMQVCSLTAWTRPLCGKQRRLQVWCHLADALAEANITRRARSQQHWVRPITNPLAFYSHLCASLKDLQGPVPIVPPRRHGCSSSEFKTQLLASPGSGAHLHSLRSLCLQGDVDTDRDGAMDFLSRLDWAREWSSLSREQDECLLQSKFTEDSSYIA